MLALADGALFPGAAYGARGVRSGEVCFNTSLSGYQEILTDPSYAGQIVVLTTPEIGNVGVNSDDMESRAVAAQGLVVRAHSPVVSNYRAEEDLEAFLVRQGVVAISGVDTRALTRHLRTHGAQPGAIAPTTDEALSVARAAPDMSGQDLASGVSCTAPYTYNAPLYGQTAPAPTRRVVAYDFGVKTNILRHLVSAGCEVTVVPASTPAGLVRELRPDGVFLSNGPGDPAAVASAIRAVSELIGRFPLFGICLGHQLTALALGGRTYKLPFGHRGGNQPVLEHATGRVRITSQNHGFCVDAASLPPGAVVTHTNLNDGTLEGFAFPDRRLLCVQYHPEASPGPHDAACHFDEFLALMR